MENYIQVVCAWCGEHMGFKEAEGQTGENISHSICPECKELHFADMRDKHDGGVAKLEDAPGSNPGGGDTV